MVAELVIHLGDHKTGTTAIQSALAAGQLRIGGAAVFYRGQQHHRLARPLMDRHPDPAIYRPRYAEIGAALDASPAAIGVISSEHFEYVAPAVLAAVIAECLPQYQGRLRLVSYVRPHVDRFVASFAERTKMGLTHDQMEPFLDRIIRQRMLDYTPRFRRWQAVFGEAFCLRPYVRDQLEGGDVVADFAALLAAGQSWDLAATPIRNSSPSLGDLALIRSLQRQGAALRPRLPDDARAALGWTLAEFMAAQPSPAPVRLGVERQVAGRIARRFQADAVALDAAFFHGSPMTTAIRAAPAKGLAQGQSLDLADNLSPAALRLAAVGAALLVQIAAADPAHFATHFRHADTRKPRTARVLAGAAGRAGKGPHQSATGPTPAVPAASGLRPILQRLTRLVRRLPNSLRDRLRNRLRR